MNEEFRVGGSGTSMGREGRLGATGGGKGRQYERWDAGEEGRRARRREKGRMEGGKTRGAEDGMEGGSGKIAVNEVLVMRTSRPFLGERKGAHNTLTLTKVRPAAAATYIIFFCLGSLLLALYRLAAWNVPLTCMLSLPQPLGQVSGGE